MIHAGSVRLVSAKIRATERLEYTQRLATGRTMGKISLFHHSSLHVQQPKFEAALVHQHTHRHRTDIYLAARPPLMAHINYLHQWLMCASVQENLAHLNLQIFQCCHFPRYSRVAGR